MHCVKELVSNVVNLVSLPDICIRVEQMSGDDNASAHDFGGLIAQDPNLSGRLLKIVNSSFYGFPVGITSIAHSVTIVGLNQLRSLVLATSAISTFERIPSSLVSMQQFWDHSITCGVYARELGRISRHPDLEQLFTAGLLSSVGKLVLYFKLPEGSRKVLEQSNGDVFLQFSQERRIHGFSYGEVGCELMKLWKLPEVFSEVARFHLEPSKAERHALESCFVHAATVLVDGIQNDRSYEDMCLRLDPVAKKLIPFSEETIEAVRDRSQEQLAEILQLFSGSRRGTEVT